MLYVFGNGFTTIDKDGLKMILNHAGIKEFEVGFIDLNYEDPGVEKKRAILCVDKSLRAVKNAIKESGAYTHAQLLTDVVDPQAGFVMVNIPIPVTTMLAGSPEDKAFTWEKIKLLAQHYREIYPFNDSLDCINNDFNQVVSSIPETPTNHTDKVEAVIKNVTELDTINLNVLECFNALYEQVNLLDPGFGMSLSKYEKFTLHTSGGDLTIYPTNRISKTDSGFKITFKDFLAVLKAGIQMNAGSITFESKTGAEVDS